MGGGCSCCLRETCVVVCLRKGGAWQIGGKKVIEKKDMGISIGYFFFSLNILHEVSPY